MKLQNQEIWLAFPELLKLAKIKLPVKASLGIGVLLSKLYNPYTIIERERAKLVSHYGIKNKEGNQVTVDFDNPNAGDFAREFGQLLNMEWEEDIQFERVKLPLKIAIPCPSCKRNMETDFLIESQTLLPLKEHFIEVETEAGVLPASKVEALV